MELAKFALDNRFDMVGLSFVKTAADIERLKSVDSNMSVVAKIETLKATQNIREIAAVADGIMVARGDLSLGVSIERLPEVQRRIINAARLAGSPS